MSDSHQIQTSGLVEFRRHHPEERHIVDFIDGNRSEERRRPPDVDTGCQSAADGRVIDAERATARRRCAANRSRQPVASRRLLVQR